jgi:hypothetical protein
VVKIISDHPGRAFLTLDGASTPPLEEGNRSRLAISSVAASIDGHEGDRSGFFILGGDYLRQNGNQYRVR